jgi:hypothetical protein
MKRIGKLHKRIFYDFNFARQFQKGSEWKNERWLDT